jgi:hypothetical protein
VRGTEVQSDGTTRHDSERRASVWRTAWFCYLAIGLVIAGAFAVLESSVAVRFTGIPVLAAVAAIAVGIRLHRPTPSAPWWVLAAGAVAVVPACLPRIC